MGVLRLPLLSVAVVLMSASAGFPQNDIDVNPPAHISYVDGSATLDREDGTDVAVASMPIVGGDRLRTARGRVEVLFPDGTALSVDEYSTVEFQAPTLLRVTNGRVLLAVAGAADPARAARFQIDTPAATATTDGPGEYRIAVLTSPSGRQTELAVMRGVGALSTERGSMPLGAGERTVAWEDGVPSSPSMFNSARLDAFDQWTVARREVRTGSRASAQYLPADLRMYGGTFDRYGAWQYEAPYGYVWYPSVAIDWRPYFYGYWASVPFVGWTWVGVDVWTWPTHHYGRWGYSRNRWFWIPDRRWAPAWVSWGAAPGYVSWCPLGYDSRPVFGLSVTVGNSWPGWVVVPRRQFGTRGRYVHQYAVPSHSLPPRTPFVVQASAPVAPPRAVPRFSSGAAGVVAGVAVPRDPNSASTAAGRVYRGSAADRRTYSSQPPATVTNGDLGTGATVRTPRGARDRNPQQSSGVPSGFRPPLAVEAPRAIPRSPAAASGGYVVPSQPQVASPPSSMSDPARRAIPRSPAPPSGGYVVPSQPQVPSPQGATIDPARRAIPRDAPLTAPPSTPVPQGDRTAPAARRPMLSTPLGPPPSMPTVPNAPAHTPAPPASPGAYRRQPPPRAPEATSAPAPAAPAASAPAPGPATQAVPRGRPADAQPAQAPAAAPRQHDPNARRPR